MLFFIRIFVAFYICNTLQRCGYLSETTKKKSKKFTKMKNRLKQVIDYYDISVNAFCIKIDISEATIRRFLSDKNGLSVETLSKISNIYTKINLDWLITGRGEMLLQEQQQEKQQKTPPPVADDTQLQRLQDLLEAKQETISVLQETNNNLLSEIQQLRNYVNVTSTKYIQMVEQTLAAATDTRSKINEIQVGFNAYHQSLAPSKHKITSSHHTPKTK